MKEEFEHRYLGKFPPNPVYKALKKAFNSIQRKHQEENKGKNKLNPPSQAMLYNFIKYLENSNDNPEDILHEFFISLATYGDELYYDLLEQKTINVKPII